MIKGHLVRIKLAALIKSVGKLWVLFSGFKINDLPTKMFDHNLRPEVEI